AHGHRRHRHGIYPHRRAYVDRGFGDAVPQAELGRAAPLAVADDPDVAARDRREIVALGLEGLPAAPPGEGPGPGDAVERYFDVERGGPFRPAVPRNVHGTDGHDRAEVVADPLAVAGRRPAGSEVVVERVLWDVAVVPARDDRGHWHGFYRRCGASVDRGLGNAVPEAELGRAAPLAVADDPDVAARDRREIVALGLQGLLAAPPGEGTGSGEAVDRHFDVERGRPFRPAVPRNGHGPDGHDRAEVVADPLAVAGRCPAGGEVVVARILRAVAVVPACDDRGYRERGKIRRGDDLCQRVAGWLGIGEIARARQRQDAGGGERRFYQGQPLGQLELEGHSWTANS